jgi:hypothetical protein
VTRLVKYNVNSNVARTVTGGGMDGEGTTAEGVGTRTGYGEKVTSLGPEEVFVFGGNYSGFHGAGAAGYASFGEHGNFWRKYGYDKKPDGWRGKWNVKGVSEGLMRGTEGCSYAIPTVTSPGARRSLHRDDIINSIHRMYSTAMRHPSWRFLVAGSAIGSQPLNGYTHDEMAAMYKDAGPIPDNVVFSDSYTRLIFNEHVA